VAVAVAVTGRHCKTVNDAAWQFTDNTLADCNASQGLRLRLIIFTKCVRKTTERVVSDVDNLTAETKCHNVARVD